MATTARPGEPNDGVMQQEEQHPCHRHHRHPVEVFSAAATTTTTIRQDYCNAASTTAVSGPPSTVPLVDITDLITACASSLSFQEPFLCRTDTFQLHDAMAATQLMDAKMDSCQVPAHLAAPWRSSSLLSNPRPKEQDQQNDRLVMDANAEVESSSGTTCLFPRPMPTTLVTPDPFSPLPWQSLTMSMTSTIILHQLIRLQALCSGASVGESVFTCLYANPQILTEMEQYLFHETDDNDETETATNNNSNNKNNSNNNKSDSDVVAQRLEQLHRKGHPKQQKQQAPRLFCAQLAIFVSTCAMIEYTELFRSIVMNADIYEEEDFVTNTHELPFFRQEVPVLRQYLDMTVQLLSQMHTEDQDNDNDDENNNNNNKDAPEIRMIQLILTFWNGMLLYGTTVGKLRRTDPLTTVSDMKKLAFTLSQGLGSLKDILVDRAKKEHETMEQNLIAQVFDSYVNRPLFGNTPVRKVSFLDPEQSIAKLIVITSELEWGVCGLLIHGTNLARIDRMLRRLSNLNILARSLIVLNLYFDDLLLGQHALQPLIIAHMKQWQYIPPDLLNSEHAQAFWNRLAKPIYDTLKLQISNRNRQRAYLEAGMFQEWTMLQNEANLVDTHYRREHGYIVDNNYHNSSPPPPPVFGYYVLSFLLKLMDQHLTSGIEGGLFHGHDEICSAFWYREFLLAALVQNLTHMRRGKEFQAKLQQEQQKNSPSGPPTTVTTTTNTAATTSSNKCGGKGGGKKGKHATANKSNGKAPAMATITATTKPAPPPQRTLEEIEDGLEVQVMEAKRLLCRGIVRFLVALRQAGIVRRRGGEQQKQSNNKKNKDDDKYYEFTSRRICFERRFAIFAETIRHPPPLSFDDYLEGSDGSNVPLNDIVQSASDVFKSCRALVDSILADIGTISAPFAPVQESEARALLKVCVGNTVYLMKLSQFTSAAAAAAASTTTATVTKKVEFDFDAHKEFCILKLI